MATVGTVDTASSPTRPQDETVSVQIPVLAAPAIGPGIQTVAGGIIASGGGTVTGKPVFA